MTQKVINHWGVWIESDTPTTGVISNNDVSQFISDEMFSSDGINLTYTEALRDYIRDNNPNRRKLQARTIERLTEEFNGGWEDQPSDTWLIGDWIKDSDGLYTNNPEGEYAAIVSESETQVVFSKYTRRGNPCSPCFPGQVEFSNEGEFLAYDLPPEAYTEY